MVHGLKVTTMTSANALSGALCDTGFFFPPRNTCSGPPPGYDDYCHLLRPIMLRPIFWGHAGRRHPWDVLWDAPVGLPLQYNSEQLNASKAGRGHSGAEETAAESKWQLVWCAAAESGLLDRLDNNTEKILYALRI